MQRGGLRDLALSATHPDKDETQGTSAHNHWRALQRLAALGNRGAHAGFLPRSLISDDSGLFKGIPILLFNAFLKGK